MRRRVYLLQDIPVDLGNGTMITLKKGRSVETKNEVADKWIADGLADEFKGRSTGWPKGLDKAKSEVVAAVGGKTGLIHNLKKKNGGG